MYRSEARVKEHKAAQHLVAIDFAWDVRVQTESFQGSGRIASLYSDIINKIDMIIKYSYEVLQYI